MIEKNNLYQIKTLNHYKEYIKQKINTKPILTEKENYPTKKRYWNYRNAQQYYKHTKQSGQSNRRVYKEIS